MKRYSLSWTIGISDKAQGGNKRLPTWQDVDFHLGEIEGGKGTLTLNVVGGPNVGPQFLQVISDDGKYLLSLGVDDGADYVVRSYLNPRIKGMEYELLGNIWGGELVCLDFSIVREAFEQFFLTGDVSSNLLS
jgi:hypothetical protein